MNNQVQLIKITHIINPSRFYCRYASSAAEELAQISKLEAKIMEAAKQQNKKLNRFIGVGSLVPGDLVGYYCRLTHKWIRCEVDELKQFEENLYLILWAIDYGVPFYARNFDDVIPLSESSFRLPMSKIFIAGLQVMPANLRFDHVHCKEVKVVDTEWSERSIKVFQKCIERATEIYFAPSDNASHYEVCIGDLLIGSGNSIDYGLSAKLVKDNVAIAVSNKDFLDHYERLLTNHIERWNDNFRSGGVLNEPEGVRKIKSFEIESTESADEHLSVVGTSDLNFIVKKVQDWQARNEEVQSDPEPEDFASFVSSRSNTSQIIDQEQIALKDLNDMMSQQKLAYKKPETSRKVIMLPAGAGMNTNNRNPAYKRIGSVAGSKEPTVYDDDHFVSISQVGCVNSGCDSASNSRPSKSAKTHAHGGKFMITNQKDDGTL